MASRAARLSGRSSYSPTATDAGPRCAESAFTTTVCSYGPSRTRTSSPTWSGRARFARSPFTCTFPPPIASDGEPARLEEARGPEPLVQPDPLVVGLLALCSHA